MVDLPFYCPEQISVPEKLPNILKQYSKAALRTQPDDLLIWSATYFRCLQMGIPPPAKLYYDKTVEHCSISKEYLRILIKQIGKVYFVSRLMLQKRWDNLCLPQDELLKFLSLCRMLHWPQIYWLKLITILIGSINKTPFDTLNMLCELLTDNIEGVEPFIPFTVFRICYTFLAELDCSKEQYFIDGRKLMENGEMEDENEIEKFSSTLFTKAILTECRNKSMIEIPNNKKNESSFEVSSKIEEFSEDPNRNQKQDSHDQYVDFDSIVLLLKKTQGDKLREYNDPLKMTNDQIHSAKEKQKEINKEYEKKQAMIYKNNSQYQIYEQHTKIVKNIGPSWLWLNEFVKETNCLDKSFNFIDLESIKSDMTTILSSDENLISIDTTTVDDVIESETTSDDGGSDINSNEKQMDELIFEKTKKNKIEENGRKFIESELEPCLAHLRKSLSKLELEKDVISQTESVITFLRKEATEVLNRAAEEYKPKIDLLETAKILEQAHQKGNIFTNFDEMIEYIREIYLGPYEKSIASTISCESIHLTTDVIEELGEEHRKIRIGKTTVLQNTGRKKCDEQIEKSETEITSLPPIKTHKMMKSDKKEVQVQVNFKVENMEDDSEAQKLKGLNQENLEKNSNITDVYENSGFNVNVTTKQHNITENEILGLIPIPQDAFPSETEEEIDESTLTASSSEPSMIGNIQDDSSLQPSISGSSSNDITEMIAAVKPYCTIETERQQQQHYERKKLNVRSNVFECKIPPLQGIGSKVSKETMQNFLTYLKIKSKVQNGMICPRNFKDPICPNMTDCKV